MRQMPSFFSLRAFEAAARLGSFALASNELHLTPSAVSHQVKALEEWSGGPLFVRETRRVILTPAGRRLVDRLTAAFDIIDEACWELRPSQERKLIVHCAPSFAAKWLGPRLPAFLRRVPGVTIELSSSFRPVDLGRDKLIDVEVSYGEPQPRTGVVTQHLGEERIVPMCAPGLLHRHEIRVPADLCHLPWIDSSVSLVSWSDWAQLNGVQPRRQARPSFDRGLLAVAAAVDGLGVALETTRFAQAELEQGLLVALTGDHFREIRTRIHHLSYRQCDYESGRAGDFVNWITDQAGAPQASPAPPAEPHRMHAVPLGSHRALPSPCPSRSGG